jgi:cytochrome c nitrite reductase small subunit
MRTAEIALAALVGVALGIGTFTFVYARGASYLTDDPAACANCHIMREQFDGWTRSSHRAAAVCNDCHAPSGFVPKYVTKARNGFWHSSYFTLGGFHEPIRITARNLDITEGACRKCHDEITYAIDPMPRAGSRLSCVSCHRNVGHLH